ncbi:MAG: VOC family protein, partial [Nitrolancea sp.]
LALFDRRSREGYQGIESEHTTVDHIAFGIALEDHQSELERLQVLGMRVETRTHAWTHWRSIFIWDPEGNCVEFVCYDPSVG